MNRAEDSGLFISFLLPFFPPFFPSSFVVPPAAEKPQRGCESCWEESREALLLVWDLLLGFIAFPCQDLDKSGPCVSLLITLPIPGWIYNPGVRVPKPLPVAHPRAPRAPCQPGKVWGRANSHPHKLPQMARGREREKMGQRMVTGETRAPEFPWGACAPRASRAPQAVPRSVPLLGERLLLSPGAAAEAKDTLMISLV